MAKPLRLLVVGVTMPMETFLDNLILGLAEKGVQVTIASTKRPSQRFQNETNIDWLRLPDLNGLNILSIFLLLIQSLPALFIDLSQARRLWAATANLKNGRSHLMDFCFLTPFLRGHWNVIYFPWNLGAASFLPLFQLGGTTIISCRGSQVLVAPHNPRRQEVRKKLQLTFQRAQLVHCVSQAIVKEAMKLGLDPAKARVIYPAINPEFFHPLPAKEQNQKFTVISTGSLHWVKGYEYALLAIRQLIREGVDLEYHIIGDGSDRQRILFTINDLGLQKHVFLHGRLSPEKVRDELQTADVFLLPSLSEGISNAALEAMACGLPVVTTNCGGMREAVTDGVEGLVVPMRDFQAMSSALVLLYEQPDMCARMGLAGRTRVLKDFNSMSQLEQWLELLELLVPSSNSKIKVKSPAIA
jgi:glycosyltransferase involved in cell wall biosynthesis